VVAHTASEPNSVRVEQMRSFLKGMSTHYVRVDVQLLLKHVPNQAQINTEIELTAQILPSAVVVDSRTYFILCSGPNCLHIFFTLLFFSHIQYKHSF
jgi:hypothetical protein